MNRRKFLQGLTVLGAIGCVPATATAEGSGTFKCRLPKKQDWLPETQEVQAIELPYAYDALEPVIDAETMELHYSKHYTGYVRGYNAAMKSMQEARDAGDYSKVQYWAHKASFNGGGYFLHGMFWKCMTPESKATKLAQNSLAMRLIQRDFGSFEQFQQEFEAAAISVEGSGWGILFFDTLSNRFWVGQIENQHKLLAPGSIPIMGIDVWEHAYYLNYQNRRSEYVKNWWRVVNWDYVGAMIELSGAG